MNIWHDIDEERIYPTDFMAVVEISMGSNMKYELDKKPACCRWTECCSRQRTTP